MTKLGAKAKKAGIDENDYETWAELGDALDLFFAEATEDTETHGDVVDDEEDEETPAWARG